MHALPSMSSVAVPAATFNSAFGYLATGWPIAYLIATVVVGIGIAVAAITYVSEPAQVVQPSGIVPSNRSPLPCVVGRITGMADCHWAGLGGRVQGLGFGRDSGENDPKDLKSETRKLKSPVLLGDRLSIQSGLLEITYDTGAKVILQGPVIYDVESTNGGFLPVGKLTGRVETEAGRGFCVRTPTAMVTDLGTEFGVEVDVQGRTTSRVFRGRVELRTISANKKATFDARILNAEESARVESSGDPTIGNRVIVLTPAATPTDFVRSISKRTPKAPEAFEVVAFWQFDGERFLADSSGHGHTLINQGASQVDGTVAFDGNSMVSTVDAIDLTPYDRIRVSWRQKVASAASDQVVWENTSDFNATPGAIGLILASGKAHAGIRTDNASPDDPYRRDLYNVDQFPVTPNEWETLTVEYDRTAYRANVVRVFKDGKEMPATTFFDGFAPKAFVNAVFSIGARQGRKDGVVGQIDDLKIEGEVKKK